MALIYCTLQLHIMLKAFLLRPPMREYPGITVDSVKSLMVQV